MKIENKNGYIHQLPQSDTNHSGCCCRVHIKWPIQIQFLPRNSKTASHVRHYVIYNISYIRFIIPRDHSIPSISQVELPVSVSAIGHHRTTHSPSVLACARIKQNGHRQNFHPTQALCLNTQNKRSLFKLCRVWCGHYTISRHNILAESRENRGRMATESAHKESPIFIMFTAHFKNDRKRINKRMWSWCSLGVCALQLDSLGVVCLRLFMWLECMCLLWLYDLGVLRMLHDGVQTCHAIFCVFYSLPICVIYLSICVECQLMADSSNNCHFIDEVMTDDIYMEWDFNVTVKVISTRPAVWETEVFCMWKLSFARIGEEYRGDHHLLRINPVHIIYIRIGGQLRPPLIAVNKFCCSTQTVDRKTLHNKQANNIHPSVNVVIFFAHRTQCLFGSVVCTLLVLCIDLPVASSAFVVDTIDTTQWWWIVVAAAAAVRHAWPTHPRPCRV